MVRGWGSIDITYEKLSVVFRPSALSLEFSAEESHEQGWRRGCSSVVECLLTVDKVQFPKGKKEEGVSYKPSSEISVAFLVINREWLLRPWHICNALSGIMPGNLTAWKGAWRSRGNLHVMAWSFTVASLCAVGQERQNSKLYGGNSHRDTFTCKR